MNKDTMPSPRVKHRQKKNPAFTPGSGWLSSNRPTESNVSLSLTGFKLLRILRAPNALDKFAVKIGVERRAREGLNQIR